MISVVIPCHNAAAYLRSSIDSVLAQTVPPREILVIDDGSTDESATVAMSYAPRVRVVKQTNRGPASARNRGIEEATGEWIAFLDADDVWRPQKLERQGVHLVDGTVAVHSGYYNFGNSGGVDIGSGAKECERYATRNMI